MQQDTFMHSARIKGLPSWTDSVLYTQTYSLASTRYSLLSFAKIAHNQSALACSWRNSSLESLSLSSRATFPPSWSSMPRSARASRLKFNASTNDNGTPRNCAKQKMLAHIFHPLNGRVHVMCYFRRSTTLSFYDMIKSSSSSSSTSSSSSS